MFGVDRHAMDGGGLRANSPVGVRTAVSAWQWHP
jgi:hypothetical protein